MSQIITRQMVADKLAAYLRHDLSLADLVAWEEAAMMDGEFEPQDFTAIRDVVAQSGCGRCPRVRFDVGRLRAIT